MEYLLYLVVGAFAGTLAGLFGIGGGMIVVPTLVYSFSAQGVSPAVLTHMAVGTSLATIVATSLSSLRAHHQKRAVRWRLMVQMTPGLLLGAWLGGVVASGLQGRWLQLIIGGFAILMAMYMLLPRASDQDDTGVVERLPGRANLLGAGGVIGVASAVFGIGGGTLTVPYLHHFGVRMQHAVATSAACGLPIALAGAVSFAVNGWGQPALPPQTVGYIHLPAWLGIAATSVLFARFGARWAHRLPALTLRRLFAGMLILVGSDFIFGFH